MKKHSPLAAVLSLITLAFGTQAAHAETPLDFAPPDGANTSSKVANASVATPSKSSSIAVSFDPPGFGATQPAKPQQQSHSQAVASQPKANTASAPAAPITSAASDQDIFSGGSNSLVARTVGSAEGTRTPEGHKTPAYHGHTDPGNGVWNLGSFSYQHEATSPEDADEKQLARLERQDRSLQQQATQVGVPEYESDLTVRLNGIDLANQSPMAALAEDGGGYIDRLRQAQEMGLQGSEAVLWARVRSFLDPDTNRWNAPGLGNTVDGISHDQARRMDAIARAMEIYQAEAGRVASRPQTPPTSQPQQQDTTAQVLSQDLSPVSQQQPQQATAKQNSATNHQETVADRIIFQSSSDSESSNDSPVRFGVDGAQTAPTAAASDALSVSSNPEAAANSIVEFERDNLQAFAN
jgi:hypothetical protein